LNIEKSKVVAFLIQEMFHFLTFSFVYVVAHGCLWNFTLGGGQGAVLFFGIKEKVQLRGNMIELCQEKENQTSSLFLSFFFLAASAAKKYSSIV
jgi:hypothetical protein